MNEELERYIMSYCREYMLQEEKQALAQSSIVASAREGYVNQAKSHPWIEQQFGFSNERAVALAGLGINALRTKIVERILNDHKEAVLNFCTRCGKLARTPKARQCRYCSYDWH